MRLRRLRDQPLPRAPLLYWQALAFDVKPIDAASLTAVAQGWPLEPWRGGKMYAVLVLCVFVNRLRQPRGDA